MLIRSHWIRSGYDQNEIRRSSEWSKAYQIDIKSDLTDLKQDQVRLNSDQLRSHCTWWDCQIRLKSDQTKLRTNISYHIRSCRAQNRSVQIEIRSNLVLSISQWEQVRISSDYIRSGLVHERSNQTKKRSYQIELTGCRSDQTECRSDWARSDQNRIRSDQIRSHRIKLKQIRSAQIRSDCA